MDQAAFDIRLSPGADRLLDAVAAGMFVDREAYLLRLQAERLMLVSWLVTVTEAPTTAPPLES